MPGLKHATKKRFAKTTTRKRTIQSGISAEYTEYQKKLDSVSNSIKSLIKGIRAARDVWLEVAKHQKDFAEALVASLPADGVVRSHAREVESTIRQLQRLIIEDEGASAPHKRITSVLEGYLRLVQAVEKEYAQLETTYTEVLRYQKKVDKLSKNGKKEVALQRNMEKLQSARSEHDRCLQDVIKRQKEAYDKHEAVFQCAHHAFWIAHDKYAQVVNEATKSIRWESVAVREHLVNIDVSNTPKLTAIPRVHMLLPPEEIRDVSFPKVAEMSAGAIVETPRTRTSGTIVETLPTRTVVETIPAQSVDTVATHRMVETVPQQVVQTVPVQQIVETVPSRRLETVPLQGVPMQTRAMNTVQLPPGIQTVHTFDTESQLYTRNAPAPIHIASPTRAEVVHMVPATAYTYQQQQQPIVHLTPEKPSVSVSLTPDNIGPDVPTEIPLPSAPPQSPPRTVTHVLA